MYDKVAYDMAYDAFTNAVTKCLEAEYRWEVAELEDRHMRELAWDEAKYELRVTREALLRLVPWK
jgi:hypothetical protein